MTIGNFAEEMKVHPSLFKDGDYPVQKPGAPIDKQFAGELRGAYTHSWIPAWSLFGNPRNDPKDPHRGIDIYAPVGTPVLSTVAGTLLYKKDADDDDDLGNRVHISFGFKGKPYRLIYGHLSSFEMHTGKIQPGTVIGYVGCTGNADHDKMCSGTNKCGMTTAHVHLALMDDLTGAYLDPLPALGWKLRYQDDTRTVDCSKAWG